MEYSEIERFLYSDEMVGHFKEGISCSMPIPVLHDDCVMESFFLSNASLDINEEIPFSYIVADCEQGRLVDYVKLDNEKMLQIKSKDVKSYAEENENKLEFVDKYKLLYCQVKEFAFNDCISVEDGKKLHDFFSALLKIASKDDMKYYFSLNQSFFYWINNVKIV